MRKRLLTILLALTLLLLAGCGSKGAKETRWLWSKAQVPLPAEFGYVQGIAKTDQDIYISGYAALGRWNAEGNTVELIDAVYQDDDPAMVYGISAFKDTAYLLTGEMLPHYTDGGEARENPDFSGTYHITAYMDGNKGKTVDFSLTESDVLKGLLALSEKEAVCWTEDCVWTIQLTDGKILDECEVTGSVTVSMGNGKEYYLCGENKDRERGYYPLYIDSKLLGDFVPVQDMPEATCTATALDGTCCFGNDENLYTCDLNNQTLTTLCRWGEMHMFGEGVCAAVQPDDNTWICVSRTEGTLYRLTGETVDADLEELHIATSNEEDVVLDELVTVFNQQSEEYFAIVDSYPYDAYDRLCTEMMAGDGPDVLNLQFSMPLNTPYLENLYPYIDNDPDLDRDTFVPTALSSLTFNGNLRSIPADFSISTLVASTKDVGSRQHWTFEEMRQILAKKGPDYHLFPSWMDQNNFLLLVANNSTGSYIDWETGTANFDCEEFRDYLRFCSKMHTITMAEDGDRALDTPAEWPYLVQMEDIQNISVLNQIKASWDEPVTFIGFPGDNGSGSYFSSNFLRLAISSNSTEKEAAWQFIRIALTKDMQEHLAQEWGALPVRNDVVMTMLEKNVPDFDYREGFTDLLAQSHRFTNNNLQLIEIVKEEAAAYFNGSKSVEEASALIQNRATLYLQELG